MVSANFSTLPFLEMLSNGTSPERVKEAIKKEQTKHDGNYEAFYGQIIKFNWKLAVRKDLFLLMKFKEKKMPDYF